MDRFDLNKIEHFIMKQDSSVVKTIKKHAAGQSGYITDKRAEYLMHYRVEEEDTGLLEEEATGLLENDGNNEKNHGFCLQKPGKWYLQSAEKSCILNVAVGNYGAFTHDCGAKAHKVEGHSLKWGSCPQR